MYSETSTVQENATRTGTAPTNLKTDHGSSCRQCWQAPRQLGISGHKSMHNLNMWGWMCSIAASQHRVGCAISNGVQFCLYAPLQYCVKAQPHSKARLYSHFFFTSHTCTTFMSAPQHTTPKLCWTPLIHRTCSLLYSMKTCASSRRIAFCDFSLPCLLSLLRCWCSVLYRYCTWIGLLPLLYSIFSFYLAAGVSCKGQQAAWSRVESEVRQTIQRDQ